MKSKKVIWIGGILVLLLVYFISTRNGLVGKQEKVRQQWAEVQSTYQRRLDLIPNLVNTVKGVSEFESSTLEQIAAARAKALSGQAGASISGESYSAQSAAQDTLAAAANRVIILIEKYPVLKGTAAYSGLQTQLEGTERRIKVARNDFNEAVATYNKSVRSFPTNLVAKLLGFKAAEGFTAAKGAEKTVEIKF